MEILNIKGGSKLSGEVSLNGAKNSGFKLMIAGLLSDEPSEITNFSKIGDIQSTAQIIKELGGEVVFGKNHILKVFGGDIEKNELSEKTGRLSRASTYFVGPLLRKFGKAVIPVPGGCKIGRRPLDRHLEGFRALGASCRQYGDYCLITAKKLKGARYCFEKNTHGGTDVMIIASVLASGETVLENAAQEPEVDDLINFLNSMGAKIKRLPDRKIVISGVDNLRGTSFKVMPDRNEAVTFACAALITKGDIFVHDANPNHIKAFLTKVDECGGRYEIKKRGIRFFWRQPIQATKIKTQPHPGFMTDWQALWTVLMTQASGISTVNETIYENRFGYVSDLVKMGAKISLFNPRLKNPEKFYNFNWQDNQKEYFHAAKVFGPTLLRASKFNIIDIRAGATLILAALVAEGATVLESLDHIDRGYEKLDRRLSALGAKIVRIQN